MKVSRTRLLRIDMGNWEKFEFGATYSVDHLDMGYTEDDLATAAADDAADGDTHRIFDTLMAECERGLAALLRSDVLDAVNLTDEKKSFILATHNLGEMPEATARSNRRKARR